MSGKELEAGKRWVEHRFEEIAREFAAPTALAQKDRWRDADQPSMLHTHCIAFDVGLEGHVKLLELTFWDIDIEDAGAGEKAAQERLERHIRDVLASYRGKRA